MKRLVVALGGNALQQAGAPATAEAQLEVTRKTAVYIADLMEKGYQVILAHGNGPQVGRIVLQNEGAANITPAMPFDVCGAMSQGMIGYHLQQALGHELETRGINSTVVTLVTQVVVNKDDPAFQNPTKPIGPFYTCDEAMLLQQVKGYSIKEDAGRGWRRVVASPDPVEIVELPAVRALVGAGAVVITVGGGGIPVVRRPDGTLEGIEAVIDKDLASERLAEDVDADVLLMLTAVDKVAINFGRPNQIELDTMTAYEAERYIREGHFAPGSMLPKVMAAVRFARSGSGRKAIVASLAKAIDAVEGETGTLIVQ